MSRKFLFLTGLLALVAAGLLTFARPHAQPPDESCPAVVREALQNLGDVCRNLERNSVCYGHDNVVAIFREAQDDAIFSQPTDQVSISLLDTIQTLPLDVLNNQWGVALMNVQANVPNSLPGQGVVFILTGDATLENAVPPEDTLPLVEPVPVTTAGNTNLRTAPSTRANVFTVVPGGTTLEADALSEDGEWMRVVFDNHVLWANRVTITQPASVADLPRLTPQVRSPMQAFRFSSGIGRSSCEQTSGSLMIQGPQGIVVNLEANGAQIEIASTVVLSYTPDSLRVSALAGSARVEGRVIPQGFYTVVALNDQGEPEGEFSPARIINLRDYEAYLVYDWIDDDVLIYDIPFEDFEDIWAQYGINWDDFDDLDFDLWDDLDFDFGFDFDFDDDWLFSGSNFGFSNFSGGNFGSIPPVSVPGGFGGFGGDDDNDDDDDDDDDDD